MMRLAGIGALLWAVTAFAQPADPFAGLERGASVPQVSETVRKGDTLDLIARRYYTGHLDRMEGGVAAIRKANGIAGDRIEIGRRLVVPYPYEGRSRSYTAAKDVTLESIATQHYGFADKPSAWWPVVYEANRGVLVRGGRKVKKGTVLTLPSIPADPALRQEAVTRALTDTMARYRAHLEDGNLESAGEDRFLMIHGYLPLASQEIAGRARRENTEALAEIERLWLGYSALQALGKTLDALDTAVDADALVTQAIAAAEKLGTVPATGGDDGTPGPARAALSALASRVAAVRARLDAAVTRRLRREIAALPELTSRPGTVEQTTARAREARHLAFQLRYHVSRLGQETLFAARADELRSDLSVAVLAVPPPAPRLASLPARTKKRDPALKRATTIESPNYSRVWFPLAIAYARGLWTGMPLARDQWGRPIEHEAILRAIVMHESRGIHSEGGQLTRNVNSETSTDHGFGQINDAAHRGMKVKLADIARIANSPLFTVARIGAKDALDVPAKDREKPLTLDFTKPAHNLIATVTVLSYSLNNPYPSTATPEEQLVKSLSGYNHGAFNRDYAQPWLDFVAKTDPKTGSDGAISAVAYGIGMRFYLGMAAEAPEIDWWKRFHKASLTNVFFLFADPYHAYTQYR